MNDSIDSLLDMQLDDLEDLPEFGSFPAGAHRCFATLEQKEVNGKPAVELSLKLIEHLELANAAEAKELQAGSIASTLYFLDNEFGRGKLKKICAVLGAHLGTGVLREIIDQTTDVECAVVTKLSANKKDPDAPYMDVKDIIVE